MTFQTIITELDAQIERLQAARNLLVSPAPAGVKQPGLTLVPKKHRKMSAEARRRIGEATRKRWAQGKMPHSPKKRAA